MFARLLSLLFVLDMLTASCVAQTQDPPQVQNSTPAATPTSTGTSAAPPKKVWTNDNLSGTKGTVSVVGKPDLSSGNKGSSTPSGALRQSQLKTYRRQILELQAKIDAIDKRVAQLKNFKGENTGPSDGLDLHGRYSMVPIEEQLKELEGRKKELQSKIGDVDNEARKAGIEPGELR